MTATQGWQKCCKFRILECSYQFWIYFSEQCTLLSIQYCDTPVLLVWHRHKTHPDGTAVGMLECSSSPVRRKKTGSTFSYQRCDKQFSPCSSLTFLCNCLWESCFLSVIKLSIFITCLLDNVLILMGEIKCLSHVVQLWRPLLISSSIEVTFGNSADDDPVQQVFSHLKWLSIMITLCIDNRKKKEEKKEGKLKATPLPYP